MKPPHDGGDDGGNDGGDDGDGDGGGGVIASTALSPLPHLPYCP